MVLRRLCRSQEEVLRVMWIYFRLTDIGFALGFTGATAGLIIFGQGAARESITLMGVGMMTMFFMFAMLLGLAAKSLYSY